MDVDPDLLALLADLRDLAARSGEAGLLARLTAAEAALRQPEFERLLDELGRPETAHRRRAWIGERLDQLGDRRPGVGRVNAQQMEAAPPGAVRLWGEQPEHMGLPDIIWRAVPGTRQYRLVTDEGVQGDYDLEPFYIAQYPVTTAQFQAFVEAPDGFGDARWWQGLAADDWHRRRPSWPRFAQDNAPRETVSWYDALAFCAWLNTRLDWPAFPRGRETRGLRLPTEWEWQWAAGAEAPEPRFPWGEAWDPARANTRESGLARTTAVGLYPAGAAPCGALDLSGNVREWCLTEAEAPAVIDLMGEGERVVRGGSWESALDTARTHYRFRFKPHDRLEFVGFRLVCQPPA